MALDSNAVLTRKVYLDVARSPWASPSSLCSGNNSTDFRESQRCNEMVHTHHNKMPGTSFASRHDSDDHIWLFSQPIPTIHSLLSLYLNLYNLPPLALKLYILIPVHSFTQKTSILPCIRGIFSCLAACLSGSTGHVAPVESHRARQVCCPAIYMLSPFLHPNSEDMESCLQSILLASRK